MDATRMQFKKQGLLWTQWSYLLVAGKGLHHCSKRKVNKDGFLFFEGAPKSTSCLLENYFLAWLVITSGEYKITLQRLTVTQSQR